MISAGIITVKPTTCRCRRLPASVAEIVRLNQHNGAFPVAGGHRLELVDDYDASLAAMAEAIRGAEHYVHFEFYITVADPTTEPESNRPGKGEAEVIIAKHRNGPVGSCRLAFLENCTRFAPLARDVP